MRCSSLPAIIPSQADIQPVSRPKEVEPELSQGVEHGGQTAIYRLPTDPHDRHARSRAGTVIHSKNEGVTPNLTLLRVCTEGDMSLFFPVSRSSGSEDGRFATSSYGGDEEIEDTLVVLDELLQPLERQPTRRSLGRDEDTDSTDTERQSTLWNPENDSGSVAETDELQISPDEEIKDLDELNEGRGAMNDVLVEIMSASDSEPDRDNDAMDDWRSAHSREEQYEEGIDTANDADTEETPAQERMPSFQVRLFEVDSRRSQEPADLQSVTEEWSGEVNEMPCILEEETGAQNENPTVPKSPKRRCSETQVRFLDAPLQGVRRTSTMTEFGRIKGRVRSPILVAVKASPAGPAVTACTVRPAEPRLSTTRNEQAEQLHDQDISSTSGSRKTAQTVMSALGTCQMLWEEHIPLRNDSSIVIKNPDPVKPHLESNPAQAYKMNIDCPIEDLKTRLRAWSWEREAEREQSKPTIDLRPKFLPLLDLEPSNHRRSLRSSDNSPYLEQPPGPPNTARHSGQSSRINSGPSSARQTQPPTPDVQYSEEAPFFDDINEDEDEDPPLSLYVKSFSPAPFMAHTQSQSHLTVPARRSSLPTQPSTSRQLSNFSVLSEESSRFPHRDSVDVYHARLKRHETEGRMNSELVNSRDSFVITRAKFEGRWGKGGSASGVAAGGWNRFGGLETIADASPPARVGEKGLDAMMGGSQLKDSGELAAVEQKKKGKAKVVEKMVKEELEDRFHPDEHVACPICEEHRPRWFEAKYREW